MEREVHICWIFFKVNPAYILPFNTHLCHLVSNFPHIRSLPRFTKFKILANMLVSCLKNLLLTAIHYNRASTLNLNDWISSVAKRLYSWRSSKAVIVFNNKITWDIPRCSLLLIWFICIIIYCLNFYHFSIDGIVIWLNSWLVWWKVLGLLLLLAEDMGAFFIELVFLWW